MNPKNQPVRPKLKTLIPIVFTLKLNNHECKYLLKKAFITLPSSDELSVIIRKYIEKSNYNLTELFLELEDKGLSL